MECHFVISLLLKNIFKGNDISANALDWITVIVSKRKSFTEPQRHVYNWAELNIERFLLGVTLTVDTWHRPAWENPQTVRRSFTGSSYGQQRCEVAGNNFGIDHTELLSEERTKTRLILIIPETSDGSQSPSAPLPSLETVWVEENDDYRPL